ncbi:MAG: hypothetical protein MUC48_02225 [Leptolyngbya sp. Prado105]|nr:hypothetical protein [Leptolyngbya sp. Prado105]
MSQKYPLYADRVEQLQKRGVGRRQAMSAIAAQPAVPLTGEWLESFWCDECQASSWYYVRKLEKQGSQRAGYDLSIVPPELWQRVTGVIHPEGNPSVGEFTRKQARMVSGKVKEFGFVR